MTLKAAASHETHESDLLAWSQHALGWCWQQRLSQVQPFLHTLFYASVQNICWVFNLSLSHWERVFWCILTQAQGSPVLWAAFWLHVTLHTHELTPVQHLLVAPDLNHIAATHSEHEVRKAYLFYTTCHWWHVQELLTCVLSRDMHWFEATWAVIRSSPAVGCAHAAEAVRASAGGAGGPGGAHSVYVLPLGDIAPSRRRSLGTDERFDYAAMPLWIY